MWSEDISKNVSQKFTRGSLECIVEERFCLKEVEINSVKFGKVSKKGDSYLSTVCRFVVEAKGKTDGGVETTISLPIITKAVPKNEARRKTFRSADFFKTEIIFYENIWPLMKAFKEEKGINDEYNELVPHVLSSCLDEYYGFIAMEDLSYRGYGPACKADGLDFEHTVIIMRLLGRFHAVSLALKDQNKEFENIAKRLEESYFAEKYRAWYKGFGKRMEKIYKHAVSTQLPSVYMGKLQKLYDTDLYGTLCRLCSVINPLSVVTQGDCWIPNFLIKYDNKQKPENVIMIDFQLARYTTLSTDLTFCLYACTQTDILDKHFDDFIFKYHQALSEMVQKLGSNKELVTLEALQNDIQEHGVFGVGMSMEAIIISLLENHEVADLDEITGETPLHDVWNIEPFQDDRRNKRLAFLIKHAVDRGFI